jgi:hypothetical protein
MALAALVAALGTWGWHARVFHARSADVVEEAWSQVKEAYPLPHEAQPRAAFSSEAASAIAQANPFSPLRRFAPPPPSGEGGAGAPAPPEPARFLYKGQIRMGARTRAIVENAATQKTHFLEVGQEVAGFKVLDITQTHVLVSDLKTHEDVVVPLVSSASAGDDSGARKAPGAPREP